MHAHAHTRTPNSIYNSCRVRCARMPPTVCVNEQTDCPQFGQGLRGISPTGPVRLCVRCSRCAMRVCVCFSRVAYTILAVRRSSAATATATATRVRWRGAAAATTTTTINYVGRPSAPAKHAHARIPDGVWRGPASPASDIDPLSACVWHPFMQQRRRRRRQQRPARHQHQTRVIQIQ